MTFAKHKNCPIFLKNHLLHPDYLNLLSVIVLVLINIQKQGYLVIISISIDNINQILRNKSTMFDY